MEIGKEGFESSKDMSSIFVLTQELYTHTVCSLNDQSLIEGFLQPGTLIRNLTCLNDTENGLEEDPEYWFFSSIDGGNNWTYEFAREAPICASLVDKKAVNSFLRKETL